MKKKAPLEADLDPPGTRSTRPGSKVADVAMANAAAGAARKRPATSPRRAGSAALSRALGVKAKKKK
jgi:hypothetical protein